MVFYRLGFIPKDAYPTTLDKSWNQHGDSIYVPINAISFSNWWQWSGSAYQGRNFEISFSGTSASGNVDLIGSNWPLRYDFKFCSDKQLEFTKGTSASVSTTATISVELYISGAWTTQTGTNVLTVSYNGNHTITISSVETTPAAFTNTNRNFLTISIGEVSLDSTQSSLGHPMYLDLDIGEAYKIENGTTVSVNDSVIIPAELPKLKPGNTTITFDNTFTKVELVPRWWKV